MSRKPWFRGWFGREYLALYPHRDRAEARLAVALLRETTRLGPGTQVLDVGCGPGRHLEELDHIGYLPVGLDLSRAMIEAACTAAPRAGLVRGDMRLIPFRNAAFDVVTSYFTSFGYFDDDDDDLSVLCEVRRVLKAGGWYLLDFLNADEVVANLSSEDRRTVSGFEVTQRRRLVEGGRTIEKRIRIDGGANVPAREFQERVRLYRPEDLHSMLVRAGLTPDSFFGGYDRSPYESMSPRCIVLARTCG